jgi:hypothetical protein
MELQTGIDDKKKRKMNNMTAPWKSKTITGEDIGK